MRRAIAGGVLVVLAAGGCVHLPPVQTTEPEPIEIRDGGGYFVCSRGAEPPWICDPGRMDPPGERATIEWLSDEVVRP